MPTKTQKSPSATAQLDRKEAADAYLKAVSGQPLTDRERKVLKRYEKDREETLRWQYYASIPQKDWRAMSGRQTKVLNEQAKLYGIPFGGASINLPDVVKAFHDFLAANRPEAGRLGRPADERRSDEPGPGTLPRGAICPGPARPAGTRAATGAPRPGAGRARDNAVAA